MDVYLVWDNSRAEHGEDATLVDVYATEESARAARLELVGADEDDDLDPGELEMDFGIERRTVKEAVSDVS